MNVTVPTYVTGPRVDELLLSGVCIDAEYHCKGCGAFGWGWVVTPHGETEELCPACGENKGELLC
jgi:hypothetical protein